MWSPRRPRRATEHSSRRAGGLGTRRPLDSFLDQWGITDEATRRWVGPRLTDFPFRCTVEPTDFDPQPLARLRKVYVAHTDPPLQSLQPSFDMAVSSGWEIHEVPCGHDMMLAAPEATAELLERIAAG